MFTTEFNHAPCPVCKSTVHGRIDKVFCSTECKNRHHYLSRRMNKPMTLDVNRQQLRNLTILEGLMQEKGKVFMVHKQALIRNGFCLDTITSVKINANRIVYSCYHFTYSIGTDGIVRVRRNERVKEVIPGFYERWEINFPDDMEKKIPEEEGGNRHSDKCSPG